jgi:transcriptional regulator with XRE-family HTH domain
MIYVSDMTGEEIKKIRTELGLSREGLAYKANISVRTVERIELGHTTEPNRATLAVIENALAAEIDAEVLS